MKTNCVTHQIELIILLEYLKVAQWWSTTHAFPLLMTGQLCHCVIDTFYDDYHGSLV